MTKKNILIVVLFSFFLINYSYSQTKTKKDTIKDDTTIGDALEFIKHNFDQTSKVAGSAMGNDFLEYFYTDEDYAMNYNYEGTISYTIISAQNCIIKFVETNIGNTKISYSEDEDRPESTPYYSVFGNLNQDTITIDFSKISRIESDRSSITFCSYNNMDLIEHDGRMTKTPPKKRKNDMLRFMKENEKDLYKKTKKYLVENKMNFETYPETVERYSFFSNRFTIQNIEKEKYKRLLKAFTFMQQNCGVPKEKF